MWGSSKGKTVGCGPTNAGSTPAPHSNKRVAVVLDLTKDEYVRILKQHYRRLGYTMSWAARNPEVYDEIMKTRVICKVLDGTDTCRGIAEGSCASLVVEFLWDDYDLKCALINWVEGVSTSLTSQLIAQAQNKEKP